MPKPHLRKKVGMWKRDWESGDMGVDSCPDKWHESYSSLLSLGKGRKSMSLNHFNTFFCWALPFWLVPSHLGLTFALGAHGSPKEVGEGKGLLYGALQPCSCCALCSTPRTGGCEQKYCHFTSTPRLPFWSRYIHGGQVLDSNLKWAGS